jgi:hypothetical protein
LQTAERLADALGHTIQPGKLILQATQHAAGLILCFDYNIKLGHYASPLTLFSIRMNSKSCKSTWAGMRSNSSGVQW